jgi:hypothetical protein
MLRPFPSVTDRCLAHSRTRPKKGCLATPKHSLSFSPDGERIAALTKPAGARELRAEREVRIRNAASGEERLRFETGPASVGLAYSQDDKWLAGIVGGGG